MPPTSNLIASSKEHFLAALNSIDGNPSLRIGRESQEYDLVYENKRYPPVLVLSEANKLLGGSQILLSDFGNSTKKAFEPLREAGFTIEKKMEHQVIEPNIWFVAQGSTFTSEKGMKFLFAPSVGKDGRSRFFWENLLKVKKGDIIFNYSEGVKGVSIATSDGYQTHYQDQTSQWSSE